MTGVSEIEYRVERELYHLDLATRARSEALARHHHESARRCFDYRYRVADIDPREPAKVVRLF